MLLVKEDRTTAFGSFHSFETLTLIPFERTCLLINLLEEQEIQWIKAYHQTVFDRLALFLDDREKEWLLLQTAPLK
jgi:Xaa-Pro aminopeptidase